MMLLVNRLAALLLLMLVLALAWFAIAEPLRQMYVQDSQVIAGDRDHIDRYQAIAGRLTRYQAELRHQRQDPELTRAVLRADSATLAAADLQQRMKSVVEAQGGALVSSQVLEPISEAPFTRIRINVRMLLSLPILQKVLHEIEGQMPYLVVRQLLVTKRNWRGRNRTRQNQPATSLDVRMIITGYWYPQGQVTARG